MKETENNKDKSSWRGGKDKNNGGAPAKMYREGKVIPAVVVVTKRVNALPFLSYGNWH